MVLSTIHLMAFVLYDKRLSKVRSDTDSRHETRQHGRPPHRIVKHLTAPDALTPRLNNPPVGVRMSVHSCDAMRKSNRIAQTSFRYNLLNLIPRHCDVSYVYIYNTLFSVRSLSGFFAWGNAGVWIDEHMQGSLWEALVLGLFCSASLVGREINVSLR